MIARNLKIRKVFATNSIPTLEVELTTKDGTVKSAVPMGTSTGKHEAVSLPVDDAIRKFSMVGRYFRTNSFTDMEDVDATLHSIDDTDNFRNIGGNLALAVSSVFLKAFAMDADLEVFEYVYNIYKKVIQKHDGKLGKPDMPMPICNMIGGWHGKSASAQSNIQEFLLLPVHQKSFSSSMNRMMESYMIIGKQLANEDENFMYGKNLESAWTTQLSIDEILDILSRVAGKNLFKIGLDVAASDIWDGRHYVYNRRNGVGNIVQEKLIRTEQLNFIEDLSMRYPIEYIEDPFEQGDYVSHAILLQHTTKNNLMICGDDLYATNVGRLQVGIENKSTNAVIVKPNQVGTITDTMKFVELAKKNGMKTIMSHRSGETDDNLISHLAVGMDCDYVKFGTSGERVVKINELLRIEEKMI